jgi:hypothetical protein
LCLSVRGGARANLVKMTRVTNCGSAVVGWQTIELAFGRSASAEYSSTNNSLYFESAAFMFQTMDTNLSHLVSFWIV